MKLINANTFFNKMSIKEIQELAGKFNISTTFWGEPVRDKYEKERIFKEISHIRINFILRITLLVAILTLIVTVIMLIKIF